MKIFFNQYSDRGKGGATVSLIELKLIWSIEKSENIRHGQFWFWLDIQTKQGNIADEILNAAMNAERTFKYEMPNMKLNVAM